eukprot:CAMPEP_0170614100 /NCGR_PEP_ID=MMETSP0224-20130122/24620_1 /TAXON_ID=285029 /ORGANISM="Togula jolla, Strain CCCM 725" /LENGTH=251 /DNA_ID=CAMNT_0010939735 /DNA_START=54 /DNA_END=805 /DNA_ORIENTATION=+
MTVLEFFGSILSCQCAGSRGREDNNVQVGVGEVCKEIGATPEEETFAIFQSVKSKDMKKADRQATARKKSNDYGELVGVLTGTGSRSMKMMSLRSKPLVFRRCTTDFWHPLYLQFVTEKLLTPAPKPEIETLRRCPPDFWSQLHGQFSTREQAENNENAEPVMEKQPSLVETAGASAAGVAEAIMEAATSLPEAAAAVPKKAADLHEKAKAGFSAQKGGVAEKSADRASQQPPSSKPPEWHGVFCIAPCDY